MTVGDLAHWIIVSADRLRWKSARHWQNRRLGFALTNIGIRVGQFKTDDTEASDSVTQ
jgi:hypothetical protein